MTEMLKRLSEALLPLHTLFWTCDKRKAFSFISSHKDVSERCIQRWVEADVFGITALWCQFSVFSSHSGTYMLMLKTLLRVWVCECVRDRESELYSALGAVSGQIVFYEFFIELLSVHQVWGCACGNRFNELLCQRKMVTKLSDLNSCSWALIFSNSRGKTQKNSCGIFWQLLLKLCRKSFKRWTTL